MIRRTRAAGFTLVELMVAMGLLAVILGATFGAFISTNVSTQQVVLTADLQNNARMALEALAADLRGAGVGASNGTVGIAPGGAWAARIPTIYTTAAQTFKDPSGNNFTLRSVWIVGAEPATVGITGSGDGVAAVITGPSDNKVRCTDKAGTQVDCKTVTVDSLGVDHTIFAAGAALGSLQPLLVHDHQRASFISPTTLSGSVGAQVLAFAEQASGAISPDPQAPFGFGQGFQIARARVVHWYLLQSDPAAPPRLFRSHPTLAGNSGTCAAPFIDETVDPTNGVKGVEMGAGPVESLQLRFVFDPTQEDDPTKYSAVDNIDPCNVNAMTQMRTLREIRIQMVSVSLSPAKTTSGGGKVVRFTTPGWEGTGAGVSQDQYPRRAYVTRVAPRNVQPYRL